MKTSWPSATGNSCPVPPDLDVSNQAQILNLMMDLQNIPSMDIDTL